MIALSVVVMDRSQIVELIRQKAAQYGVSPEYMLAKAKQESSFNPYDRARTSSAKGLYQFLDKTWGQYGKGGDVFDPAANTDAAARFTLDNQRTLQRAGYDTTPGNLYLAHFLGPGGAKAVLGADPTAHPASVLRPEVLKANKFLNNMNIGQLQQWAARKMGAPIPATMLAGGTPTRGLGGAPTSPPVPNPSPEFGDVDAPDLNPNREFANVPMDFANPATQMANVASNMSPMGQMSRVAASGGSGGAMPAPSRVSMGSPPGPMPFSLTGNAAAPLAADAAPLLAASAGLLGSGDASSLGGGLAGLAGLAGGGGGFDAITSMLAGLAKQEEEKKKTIPPLEIQYVVPKGLVAARRRSMGNRMV
jgi:hypothetical protein